ncbi:hypothetical protein [Natronococcus wangiae]|uniref:hypothetical protein n=1 Tax=Natronococcus wangiae TaxID=3068275 RepID=UPI00273D8A93|nr:hypothetical protein [Natronococcus sp. AD5]
MKSRVYRAMLLALYQFCIVVGIIAMPVAMATRRIGFTLPLHRLIENVGEAYEAAQPD